MSNFMKLRIKGNSLRLRVSRSELARFQAGDRIEETIRFAETPDAKLTYALESAAAPSLPVRVRYGFHDVTVILSEDQVRTWVAESEVGVYSNLDIGSAGSLDVIVEKDFACLDRSDEENQDTFANPLAGGIC
jgi:Family of unknown function (DUF7009)